MSFSCNMFSRVLRLATEFGPRSFHNTNPVTGPFSTITVLVIATMLLASNTEMAVGQQTPPMRYGFSSPISGNQVRLVSGFGPRWHPIFQQKFMHEGIDWQAPKGHAVVASADGMVVFAGRKGTYGNYIELQHGDGLQTAYAHLSKIEPHVMISGNVRRGEIIGRVGATGLAAHNQLHFEVRRNGKPVNPLGD